MTHLLVTGGTGQLGQLVLQALEQRVATETVSVLVRSDAAEADFKAKGYDVRRGDYKDVEALKTAFAGIDRLLLISGSEIGQRIQQHQNVIDAAKENGVSSIVYTSVLKAADSPLALAGEHKITEDALAASGISNTILRNGWYNENYTPGLPQVLAMGQQFGAAKDGKFSTASRKDYAEAAAIVLTSEGHDGKTYELGGDTSFTLTEFATLVGDLSGKDIAYTDMPEAAFSDALIGAGLPDALAKILADSDAGAAEGWLETSSKELSILIGRPTTPIRETLRAALAAL